MMQPTDRAHAEQGRHELLLGPRVTDLAETSQDLLPG